MFVYFHFFYYNEVGDSMSKILLVEDNDVIVKGLTYSLEQEGYEVEVVGLIADVKASDEYAAYILDIMLPDGSGKEILSDLRKKTTAPILFLTALDTEDTIVECFNMGADDYITKPFRTRELISRLNRLLKKNEEAVLIKDDIELYLDSARVYQKKKEVTLTPLEYKILLMLFSNRGKVITREQILDKIYDMSGNFVNDNTLTVYIKRIRQKLGEEIIQTVKGIGYRVD